MHVRKYVSLNRIGPYGIKLRVIIRRFEMGDQLRSCILIVLDITFCSFNFVKIFKNQFVIILLDWFSFWTCFIFILGTSMLHKKR